MLDAKMPASIGCEGTCEALVLGVAQDGGVPHMACTCRNCTSAASQPSLQQYAVSLALIVKVGMVTQQQEQQHERLDGGGSTRSAAPHSGHARQHQGTSSQSMDHDTCPGQGCEPGASSTPSTSSWSPTDAPALSGSSSAAAAGDSDKPSMCSATEQVSAQLLKGPDSAAASYPGVSKEAAAADVSRGNAADRSSGVTAAEDHPVAATDYLLSCAHDAAVTATPPSSAEACAWLIDCGPDIKQQWRVLQARCPGVQAPRILSAAQVKGVFLTHLHMGHYIGLFQFGKEAAQASGLTLYCTASASDFLHRNQPWLYYIQLGIFSVHVVQPGVAVQLTEGLTVTPVTVPHRQEFSDTVAYSVTGPSRRKLFWCPDIDSWQEWDKDVREVVLAHDTSFLDACFYSPEELDRRDMGAIPHPLVTETLARLEGLGDRVALIHMNHTNPVWDPTSDPAGHVLSCGFKLCQQGSVYAL